MLWDFVISSYLKVKKKKLGFLTSCCKVVGFLVAKKQYLVNKKGFSVE